MRAHRTTRGAVAVFAAALALTPAVTGTARAAAKDVDIQTCLSGGGFPSAPGDDFDDLDDDKPLVCVGGSHDGETITLGGIGGRGDRPTGNGPLPGFENEPSSGRHH